MQIHPEAMATLPTPCLVIDLEVVDANVAAMAELTRRHRVALRPHVKTHKCRELAARQLGAGAEGLTVATLDEAEVMADPLMLNRGRFFDRLGRHLQVDEA